MVLESFDATKELFEAIPFRRILSNGRMELLLKSMLAVGWESLGAAHGTVMDKKFNGVPIDVVALDSGRPIFWIEAKCDFAEKPREARKRASLTVRQARSYRSALRRSAWKELRYRKDQAEVRAFRRTLLNCPAYIVHFLNHVPADLPEFIRRKHDSGIAVDRAVITPAQLIEHYHTKGCTEVGQRILWRDSRDAKATVTAVIVEVR